MKVALISDTHGYLPPPPPEAEFILHAGDLGPDRSPAAWLGKDFRDWHRAHGKPVYGTWGNHDFIGETHSRFEQEGALIVSDDALTIHGVQVWFSPWSNRFGRWAFMAGESVLAEWYRAIPEDVEVIVTHGPPYGCCDRALDGTLTGSQALVARCAGLPKLRLVVTGHIHEARGLAPLSVARPDVTVINCSAVTECYELRAQPYWLVEW